MAGVTSRVVSACCRRNTVRHGAAAGTKWRLSREKTMKAMKGLFGKLLKDERGGEVLEYALILGLIVVATVTVITTVGTKVLAKWNSVNSAL
jgi:Flp pilus assembly pilin Flp